MVPQMGVDLRRSVFEKVYAASPKQTAQPAMREHASFDGMPRI